MAIKKSIFLFLSFFLLGIVFGDNSIPKLSKQLVSGKEVKGKKIAVLAFPYHDGKISSGSSIIPERLTTHLVGISSVKVMERRLLKRILEEKKLQETSVIDPGMAKKIGAVLGVNAIITGTLIDLNDKQTEVNARVIDAGTGEILKAARGVTERVWKDDPRVVMENVAPPLTVKKGEVKSKLEMNENEDEDDSSASANPPQTTSSLKVKKFSNESFPPSRRIYHSAYESNHPMKSKGKSVNKQNNEDDSQNSYDDGYLDAQREMLNRQSQTSHARKNTNQNSSYDRPLGVRGYYERTTYQNRNSGAGVPGK